MAAAAGRGGEARAEEAEEAGPREEGWEAPREESCACVRRVSWARRWAKAAGRPDGSWGGAAVGGASGEAGE